MGLELFDREAYYIFWLMFLLLFLYLFFYFKFR